MRFILENETAIAEQAQFVPLNEEQISEQQQKLDDAVSGSGS